LININLKIKLCNLFVVYSKNIQNIYIHIIYLLITYITIMITIIRENRGKYKTPQNVNMLILNMNLKLR
jgi:hypothetical protein